MYLQCTYNVPTMYGSIFQGVQLPGQVDKLVHNTPDTPSERVRGQYNLQFTIYNLYSHQVADGGVHPTKTFSTTCAAAQLSRWGLLGPSTAPLSRRLTSKSKEQQQKQEQKLKMDDRYGGYPEDGGYSEDDPGPYDPGYEDYKEAYKEKISAHRKDFQDNIEICFQGFHESSTRDIDFK